MHSGHRERVKQKYLLDGIDKFSDHEILELALYYAIPRKNTNEIAHKLLNKFGSIASVLDASISMLKNVDGMGEASALLIKLVSDLTRVYWNSRIYDKNKIMTYKESCEKIALNFIGRSEEVVVLMLFNAKNKVVFEGVINKGTVNAVDLYARKMVEIALNHNAASALVAHNHPSGVAIPSSDDLSSTAKLEKIFRSVGIRLKDHIIVADGDYVSLASSDQAKLKELLNNMEKNEYNTVNKSNDEIKVKAALK